MKTLLSAPQKDGHLVSKTVTKGLLYWGWQYFIHGYGQFVEVSLVESVLMKAGLHERRHLTLLWIATVKRECFLKPGYWSSYRECYWLHKALDLAWSAQGTKQVCTNGSDGNNHTWQSTGRLVVLPLLWSAKLLEERRKAAARVLLECGPPRPWTAVGFAPAWAQCFWGLAWFFLACLPAPTRLALPPSCTLRL